ncbi:D-alanyl-D-alanine carboxypeptidase/D-alanyl-D-alanine-endopeptidase [Peribacillus simplex]|uniref:D-alanyl-D-alanine carboxypeptidase/D-alanyl-D-alanine-endopeptidase n=2 Tax=Peribacillus TaxID=2675229 RepID=A0AAW7IKW2_9BACI|nr:D-alanyl-D-alanine carboxypeptidase/D-alanyl-D-alanine-endopeptidase [Peribacillus simplex]MDF9763582.1 D-alanyl-D-alanine carboxypeptidase/D-alanyl-D-alanine-endopeptidase (penicillin-binding protein 4) [Peribacillus simplex]MDM5296471.1 D-alanyl-D-alanine carboxypeptidase/D-alanyl-D-alanine-endopeptidase [Peribacillus simplex]MDM5455513.1 D-alanyl-D-alanine carboxypeptidase/D-alanyl-D-alanine-endopeptidase [Peribacillus simplex]
MTYKRKLSFIFFLFLICFFNGESMQAANDDGNLGQEIQQILDDSPGLAGALTGISIRSAESGEMIYERGSQTRLRPASNLKLLTAAAALETLGEDHVFQTELYIKGVQVGHVLQGNVYLKGKGDPTLLEKDFDELASSLKHKQVKLVHGDLIGDDSWYDDIRYSRDLVWSDEQEYYGAAVSALTASPNDDYDTGTIIVEITPGEKAGKMAKVMLKPETDYVKIINKTKTVAADGKQEIEVERSHGTDVITITGTIPEHAGVTEEWISVKDPTEYALSLFEKSMKKHGIKVLGKRKKGKAPVGADLIATHQSMPLSQLLIPFMKLSNNGHAEVLVKEMGKEAVGKGSWKDGLKVARNQMKGLGLNMQTIKMRDGSGISQVNMIPANEITKLLYAVQEKTWFPAYLNALPIAGNEKRMVGGTLRKRMKGTNAAGNVRAKTGTISGTSSLSGYVTTKRGERVIFSIIVNNFMEEKGITAIQDKIAVMLAEQEKLLVSGL